MKIDFTKKEYRLLLDIVSIADCVMSSHKSEPDERVTPYLEFQQKIFSCAKEFGLENLISHDKELHGYYPTMEFESSFAEQGFLDEYDEATFWDVLSGRLAQRDLVDEMGEETFISMNEADRMVLEDNKADMYLDEFEINGIMNLRVSHEIIH